MSDFPFLDLGGAEGGGGGVVNRAAKLMFQSQAGETTRVSFSVLFSLCTLSFQRVLCCPTCRKGEDKVYVLSEATASENFACVCL